MIKSAIDICRIPMGLCFKVLFLNLITIGAIAQQEWSQTQYQFNLFDVNPAYAGNHQTLSMAVRHRSQWLGFDGAPTTDQLSVHAPLANDKAAIGLRLVSDRIGARRQLIARGTGVYKLNLHEGKLAFGITGGVIRQCLQQDVIHAADADDAVLAQAGDARTVPTVGASIFYSTKRFFAGLDASQLNRSSLIDGAASRLFYHLSAVGGYILPLRERHLLELSGLLRYAEGGISQAEFNAQFLYRNLCWIGAGYRWNSSLQFLAAWMVSDHLRLGISYDYGVGNTIARSMHSMEAFLGYTLQRRSPQSIRYF